MRLLLHHAPAGECTWLRWRSWHSWFVLPRVLFADGSLAQRAPAGDLRARLRETDRGSRRGIPTARRLRRPSLGPGLPRAARIGPAHPVNEPPAGSPADLSLVGWTLAALREASRPAEGSARRSR